MFQSRSSLSPPSPLLLRPRLSLRRSVPSMSLPSTIPQLPAFMEVDSSAQSGTTIAEQATQPDTTSADKDVVDDVDVSRLVSRVRVLILEYLVRSCHKKTAIAFAAVVGKELDTGGLPLALDEVTLDRLDRRAVVFGLMHQGKILDALSAADDLLLAHAEAEKCDATKISELAPALYFDLVRQQFVELVRQGSAEDALQFAQTVLAPLARYSEAKLDALQDVTVLLAYVEPTLCPAGSLMDLKHREILAEKLNSQLYAACSTGHPKADSSGQADSQELLDETTITGSALERILRQLFVCGEMSTPPVKMDDLFK